MDMKQNIIVCVAVSVAMCFAFLGCANQLSSSPIPQTVGAAFDPLNEAGDYYAAGFDGVDFWAAGSNGLITRISIDNKEEVQQRLTENDLKDLWTENGQMLICGDNGTILYSSDLKEFQMANAKTTINLSAVTSFHETYFAGGEGGVILSSSDGLNWEQMQLPIENDIIGLAGNDNIIIAITKESDYCISTDGSNWICQNYNQYYDGYAEPCIFSALRNMGDTFFVAGQLETYPDMPFIMYTETGEVWLYKPLTEINGTSPSSFFPLNIHAIGYNLDQIVTACNQGRLLTVTNCAECNECGDYAQVDLYDLAFGNESLLIVGGAYTHSIVNTNDVRQYKIQAEQAWDDYNQRGAVIIDVRSLEEREEGYIPGSLHIPVGEIRTRLLQEVPDQEAQLIFYCAGGGRAQTAVEEALQLGYQKVYNVGGISDWPYEIV